ncbi:ribonuclease E domain-containing protein [Marimonas lutisalis]|uniref:hypothetical protein n=1 Tax=Marimonas lutisalis TaxID=2545756 RepID=UPI0010F8759A|nr:hypothetical protein [Marimonas lutisalis]
MHRSFPGWNRVGEVALDSPDLAGALAVLRETAQQINGKELTTKLVIPNDQIKYLSLDLGVTTETERETAIRGALDGATPYPVDHLVFDWSVEGDQTLVAAVARETLAEAEAFAADHGFAPMSFVAIPQEGAFSGEPFFGQTRHADSVLPEGEAVQRDMAAIRVTGVARLPEDEAEDDAETTVALSGANTVDEAAAPEAEATAPEAADDMPEDETADDEAPGPEVAAEAAETAPDENAADEGETEAAEPTDEPVPHDALEEEPTAEPEPVFEHKPVTDTPPEPAPEPDPETELEAEPEAVDEIAGAATDTDTGEPEEETQEPEAAADAAPVPAFSTIRARRDEPTTPEAPRLSGVKRGAEDLTAPSIPIEPDHTDEAPTPAIEATPMAYGQGDLPGDDIPPIPPAPEYEEVGEIPPFPDHLRDDAPAAEDMPAHEAAEPAAKDGMAAYGRRGAAMAAGLATSIGSGLAARKARRAEARGQAETETAPLPDPDAERQRMTVFGAREREKKKTAAVGGKPRYLGLILTAVLLLFLAGVAAWASIFVDEGLSRFFGPRDTAVATLPADAVDEMSVEGEEAMVPTPPEDMVETAALEIAPPQEEAPPALAEPQAPHALSLEEAQARYAVTGVWLRAPEPPALPQQADLEELYVASIDARVEEHDAVALPAITSLTTDEVIARVATPAARGTVFDLNDAGLVVATVEGALSPEGFMVYAGRPPVVPDALPQREETADPALSEALQKLAAFRPKPRPEGLVEENERQTLGGLTLAELAQIRPKLRPESAQEQAAATAAAAQAAAEAEAEAERQRVENAADAAVAEAQAAAEAQDPTAGGTAQAVPVSVKPEARPRNFSRIVERAQQADEREATRVAAAVPRQQAVAPSIPSKSNVAKAATVRNQLNLRKVNLIGVYGKPSSRRALVRLSNGRYKKVKVGDRLDGGRVQAIGESELRYSKNGRNVILQMPRG